MSLKSKVILFISLILTTVLGILNLRVYNSYVDQYQILVDFNNKTWGFKNFENMEVDFPNFTVTSMHLKCIKARYLMKDKKYVEALDILNSIEYDPLKLSEVQKAEAYLTTGDIPKMFDSAKLGFESLPRNQAHLIYYLKALSLSSMNSEILDLYIKYVDKDTSDKWLYFYFTAVFGIMDETNSDLIKRRAKDTYHSYKEFNNKELNTVIYYILYGKKNYKESLASSTEASEMFAKNDFIGAANNYKKAFENFPINPDNYYNNMASSFKSNNFLDVIETYRIIPDSINPNNGKFEFLVAKAYLKKEDSINSCKFFKESIRLNFKLAKSYYINLCEK